MSFWHSDDSVEVNSWVHLGHLCFRWDERSMVDTHKSLNRVKKRTQYRVDPNIAHAFHPKQQDGQQLNWVSQNKKPAKLKTPNKQNKTKYTINQKWTLLFPILMVLTPPQHRPRLTTIVVHLFGVVQHLNTKLMMKNWKVRIFKDIHDQRNPSVPWPQKSPLGTSQRKSILQILAAAARVQSVVVVDGPKLVQLQLV